MTAHIKTRNEKIYQDYLELLKKDFKPKCAIEKLSNYIWDIDGVAECLSFDTIRKIIYQQNKNW